MPINEPNLNVSEKSKTNDNLKLRQKKIEKFKLHEIKSHVNESGEKSSLNSTIPELETIISWTDLKVDIKVKGKSKTILSDVSGQVNNLDMLCILGPSGAGKTTLLNVITGKIKDYTGSVDFYSKNKKTTFAYVAQTDQLAQHMTVKESLLFASKLKNTANTNHFEEVKFVLNSFKLESVRNQFTSKCSGGERKRLSIGLEMISKPKILILDEATSGLDSTTSYTVIEVLKKINKNTTILTTIHQPSSRLFFLFDKCYVLSNGKNIYNGTTGEIVNSIDKRCGIICPEFVNPADFIIEIANYSKTKKGRQVIDKLVKFEKDVDKKINLRPVDSESSSTIFNQENKIFIFHDSKTDREIELQKIDRSSFKRESHFFREYYENLKKMFISNLRDPQQTILRTFNSMNFPIIIVIVMKKLLGKESGCAFLPLNATHILPENSYARYARLGDGEQDSCTALVNLMFTFYSAMIPATLVLSQHINLLRKEYLNSYYTLNSFFWALITTNLAFSLIYSTANSVSFFIFTHYEYQTTKFFFFWTIIFLTNNLGDLFGFFLSICFPEEKNKITALVAGGVFSFGMQILCGFFIQIKTMRAYMQKLTWFVFTRHSFEAMMKTLYGKRCKLKDEMKFDYNYLKDFVKLYNGANDIKLRDIDQISFKVNSRIKEADWHKSTTLEFIGSINNLNNDEMRKLDDFWDNKTNLILNAFDLHDSNLAENFIFLIVTIFILVALCYFAIMFKFRR